MEDRYNNVLPVTIHHAMKLEVQYLKISKLFLEEDDWKNYGANTMTSLSWFDLIGILITMCDF